MTQPDFDKELSELYQKRKQQITAPDVEFSLSRSKTHWLRKSSLLMFGGLSAFGLMAIVNHYTSYQSEEVKSTQPIKYVLEVTQYEEPQEESIIIPQPPLPHKINKLPQLPIIENVPTKHVTISSEIDLPKSTQSIIELPKVKPSIIQAVSPSLKVMPEYDVFDLNGAESASIELRYQVNVAGLIYNIEVVDSSVNRKLQKSAIKALSQWRYAEITEATEQTSPYYRVVFDFKAAPE